MGLPRWGVRWLVWGWVLGLLAWQGRAGVLMRCPAMPPCFCDARSPGNVFVRRVVCADVSREFPVFVNTGDFVETLTMMYAGLRSVPAFAFRNLRAISIELQGNKLGDRVDGKAFAGVHEYLGSLNLEWSGLTSLHHKVFRGMIELKNLSLAENRLKHLPHSIFQDLRNLRRLYLAGNSFTYLSPYTFRYQVNLEVLDLGYCNLQTLPGTLFAGLWNLEQLDLRGNGLRILFPGIFEDLWSLNKLQLSHNPIRQLHVRVFEGLSNLEHLQLQESSIEYIAPGVFRDTPKLRKLDLADNRLVALASGVFSDVTNMEWMSLDGNSLSSLPGDVSSLGQLHYLDLSYNNLTTLDRCWFVNFHHLWFLNLRQNPFVCDCSLFWVRSLQRLLLRHWEHQRMVPFIPGHCAQPADIRGIGVTSWLDVSCMGPPPGGHKPCQGHITDTSQEE